MRRLSWVAVGLGAALVAGCGPVDTTAPPTKRGTAVRTTAAAPAPVKAGVLPPPRATAPAKKPQPRPVLTAPSPPAVPGATAKCRDGSLSYSKHASGTCSRHGGVAIWYHRPKS